MRNIEIKCRVRDRRRIETVLEDRAAQNVGVLRQRDVFFRCRNGRLKLRLADGAVPELIQYQREDSARLRSSDYTIARVEDHALEVLERALGRLGEVRKQRSLYRLQNIRIHLDDVEELGSFLEIEAIVDAEHPESSCHAAAQDLLQQFGIAPGDIVAKAYIDLLLAEQNNR